MNKKKLKKLLMKIRTHENEQIINNFLGQIDIASEVELKDFFNSYGDTEEKIISYINKFISDKEKSIVVEESNDKKDIFISKSHAETRE